MIKELTYEEALEFYNRWGRTIYVGSSPEDYYSFNKAKDQISLDDCVKKWLNYYDGPVHFFLDQRTADRDSELRNKFESIQMNKNKIRLTESDLHRIIRESVKKVLNEADGYSYNGEDERNTLRSRFSNEIEREENYKENIKRFKEAYRLVSSEYSVIKSLKRKPSVKSDAQLAFSEQSFLRYVKRTEGDTLFDKIWEKFGGEYGEVADQYIQDCIFKLQNKSTV